jgi:hypothetical protein
MNEANYNNDFKNMNYTMKQMHEDILLLIFPLAYLVLLNSSFHLHFPLSFQFVTEYYC